jgi:hypothetical protein
MARIDACHGKTLGKVACHGKTLVVKGKDVALGFVKARLRGCDLPEA